MAQGMGAGAAMSFILAGAVSSIPRSDSRLVAGANAGLH